MKLKKVTGVVFKKAHWTDVVIVYDRIHDQYVYRKLKNNRLGKYKYNPSRDMLNYDGFEVWEVETINGENYIYKNKSKSKKVRLSMNPDLLFRREHWDNLYIKYIPSINGFKYVKYVDGLEQILGDPSGVAKSYDDFIAMDRNVIAELDEKIRSRKMKLVKDPSVLFTKEHWGALYIKWMPLFNDFRYVHYIDGEYIVKGVPDDDSRNHNDFTAVDIRTLEKKENKQDKENSMSRNYVGKFNVVGVVFEYLNKKYESGDEKPVNTYYYKIDPSIEVYAGYPVVVDGVVPKIAVVCEVFKDDFDQRTIEAKNKADTWIINIIDDTLHRKRMEATERQKFLKMEMERVKDEFNEMQILEAIAQNNPSAKKLLDEIKNLENFGDEEEDQQE